MMCLLATPCLLPQLALAAESPPAGQPPPTKAETSDVKQGDGTSKALSGSALTAAIDTNSEAQEYKEAFHNVTAQVQDLSSTTSQHVQLQAILLYHLALEGLRLLTPDLQNSWTTSTVSLSRSTFSSLWRK